MHVTLSPACILSRIVAVILLALLPTTALAQRKHKDEDRDRPPWYVDLGKHAARHGAAELWGHGEAAGRSHAGPGWKAGPASPGFVPPSPAGRPPPAGPNFPAGPPPRLTPPGHFTMPRTAPHVPAPAGSWPRFSRPGGKGLLAAVGAGHAGLGGAVFARRKD